MTATAALPARKSRAPLIWAAAGYLALWTASAWITNRSGLGEWGESIALLVILGGIFPGLAWLLTRRTNAAPITVAAPLRQTIFLAAWICLLTVYFIVGPSRVAAVVPAGFPLDMAKMAIKLLLFVALPSAILIGAYGERLSTLFSLNRRGMAAAAVLAVAMLLFQAFFGGGLKRLGALHLSPATIAITAVITFVYLVFDVALVEEFFFRTLLQERLSAVFRSDAMAVVSAAVVFALIHVPGIYLRTGITGEGFEHPTLLASVAYMICVNSVAGIFLGVLWARTRNLAAVMLVHAATDLLPQMADVAHWLGK